MSGVHYEAVDHSLAYSYSKLFLHCFSLILTLISHLKAVFLDSYLGFCSCIQLFIVLNFYCQLSPTCISCFSILDLKRILTYIKRVLCLRPYKLMLISFSAHVFLLFYHRPYILKFRTCSTKSISIFGIAIYVFRNLF